MQISDGVKKWSILLPTYPLPAKWRVAVRRKGLANLELVGPALDHEADARIGRNRDMNAMPTME